MKKKNLVFETYKKSLVDKLSRLDSQVTKLGIQEDTIKFIVDRNPDVIGSMAESIEDRIENGMNWAERSVLSTIKVFYTIPTTIEEIKHLDQIPLLKSFSEILDVGDTPRSYPKTEDEVIASRCHPQCRVLNNEFLYTIQDYWDRQSRSYWGNCI